MKSRAVGALLPSEITGLQFAYIAFDSKTLRMIAEAEGSLNVFVTVLPGL